MMKRAALATLGVMSLFALAACAGEAEAPASEAEAPATPTLAIDNARLMLAPVAGNPAALYFDLSYSGPPSLTIDSIAVEGAGMSMIHQTAEKNGAMTMTKAAPVALINGESVVFASGGMHVMAMQPSADWKAGGRVNVTLTLSDGTADIFPADVRAAGEER